MCSNCDVVFATDRTTHYACMTHTYDVASDRPQGATEECSELDCFHPQRCAAVPLVLENVRRYRRNRLKFDMPLECYCLASKGLAKVTDG